jgi:hypothetical protein
LQQLWQDFPRSNISNNRSTGSSNGKLERSQTASSSRTLLTLACPTAALQQAVG